MREAWGWAAVCAALVACGQHEAIGVDPSGAQEADGGVSGDGGTSRPAPPTERDDGGVATPDGGASTVGQTRPQNRYSELCDVPAGGFVFAEHAYPGKTAEELVGVRALGHYIAQQPVSYTHASVAVQVRDGFVGVSCASGANATFDRVVFFDDF